MTCRLFNCPIDTMHLHFLFGLCYNCQQCANLSSGGAMESKLHSEPAPDFEATDSAGKILRLSDFKGNNHVVLVFNRTLM